MRLKGDEAAEYRFEMIIRLRATGKSQKAISVLTSCSQCWVSRVLKRRGSLGTAGMRVQGKAPGKPSKLSGESLEGLKNYLLEGALGHGFETDNWTRERIAQLIKSKFDTGYHVSHMSKLMRRIGFSLQKPAHRSYRKDESAAEEWKSETLGALKKSR